MNIKPKIGDIFLFKNDKHIVSKLIKLFTRSPYSHAGVYLGNNKIAEALTTGFKINKYTLDYVFWEKVDIYRLKKGKINPKLLKISVIKKLNTGYGFKDIFKISLFIISGKQLFKKRSQDLICSEAVCQIYLENNFDLFPNVNLDYITPAAISQNKKLKKIW